MKSAILLTLALIMTSFSFCQNIISGSVKDKEGKGIQSSTVSLLRSKDSSLAKISLSDKTGKYEFIDIKAGSYLLSISSVGFNKSYSASFEHASENTVVAEMILSPKEKKLGEVTVTAIKPFIETKIDRTIINVESSPTSAGSTALEILEKSPGITVNNDGIISLRGKTGVVVMLDGKPTYMSPADLANLLKNMPASALDQIEIMTNPSAKYDAAGNSGVINIKTKKGRNNGFNGSFMVGATASIYRLEGTTYVVPKSQNSFNFNYKKNKLNFFGNYNPNYFRGRNTFYIDRKFYNAGVFDGTSTQVTKFKFGNTNHTLKLGLDFTANKKNVFGVVVSGFIFNGHPTPQTVSDIKDKDNDLQYRMISNTKNNISFKNITTNLNWKHNFDSAGRELTADFDFVRYNNVSDLLLSTGFYDANGQAFGDPLLLRGNLPSDITIYSFKSDYAMPLKNGRFEAGIKTSFVKNDNLVEYDRQLPDKSWSADSRSNHFIYDENINAVYANLNKKYGKWSLQGGLRLENTMAKGYQVRNDSTFRRDLTNLFPSVFISHEFNKKNQLTLSYSRRITRPNYQDLNPFVYFLDSLSYRVGNPYLLPQFTHNIELSYAYKNSYIFTFNYNNTNNVISQVLKQNTADKITFLTSENVAKFTNIGLSITAPFTVTKWWRLNFFTNIYNNHYKGIYNNDPIDISYTSFMANMTNNFTISKTITGEISGFYRHRGVDQLSINEPVYQMSMGVQKQIIRGKGTLRLNIRDPFAWMRFKNKTEYSDINVQFLGRPDTRQVTSTFTYRFGKNNPSNQARRRNSSPLDEQNRVGQAL